MIWKKQISSPYTRLASSSSSSTSYNGGVKPRCSGIIRKGHVPLMVGKGEEDDHVRFMVPAKLMKHPSMAQLLQESADEFGYTQQGVLRIPCDPRHFLEIVSDIRLKKTYLLKYLL